MGLDFPNMTESNQTAWVVCFDVLVLKPGLREALRNCNCDTVLHCMLCLVLLLLCGDHTRFDGAQIAVAVFMKVWAEQGYESFELAKK